MRTPEEIEVDLLPQKDGTIAIIREGRDGDGPQVPDRQGPIHKPGVRDLLGALSTARQHPGRGAAC